MLKHLELIESSASFKSNGNSVFSVACDQLHNQKIS